jgi:L-ribulose-5-phosphate 4-epimerase
MLEELKRRTLDANLRVVHEGLVTGTFGNVSAIDRDHGIVVIKASGVPYAAMTTEHMVAVELETGRPSDTRWNPSSDTPTHLELYKAFPAVGGVVHTHSVSATSWAQACRDIPPFGTTHADYFNGPVPCTRSLSPAEIETDYERNTGKVIIEHFKGIDPLDFPAVLVASHGPFAWGATVEKAVDSAVYLEYIAKLAANTLQLNPMCPHLDNALLAKHFGRKHGPGAYYGQ